LRALYARIVAYKNEQSRWPAKRNLPSPGIESCVDGDGDPMHRDMIVHYWENCEFLDGKGRQGVLVYIPAKQESRGRPMWNVLEEDGSAYRTVHDPRQPTG
ncbi:MAG: hypothetical protein ACYSVY_15270, partial [Planctomycetota bacterium]